MSWLRPAFNEVNAFAPRVDPHAARQLEDVKIPRYLDDGNVEDWAKTLSCGFCKTNLSLGDQGVVMDSGTRARETWVLGMHW